MELGFLQKYLQLIENINFIISLSILHIRVILNSYYCSVSPV